MSLERGSFNKNKAIMEKYKIYHITLKVDKVVKLIERKLKKSSLGIFKRRRFIRALRKHLIRQLSEDGVWDSKDTVEYRRIFYPTAGVFCTAMMESKVNPSEMEYYLSDLEHISIGPNFGTIKYKKFPSLIVYDELNLANKFSTLEMEKKYNGKSKMSSKDNKWYLQKNEEPEMNDLFGIMGIQRGENRLCEYCKYYNMKKFSLAASTETNKDNINEYAQIVNNNEYLMPSPPPNTIYDTPNTDDGYIIINDNLEVTEI